MATEPLRQTLTARARTIVVLTLILLPLLVAVPFVHVGQQREATGIMKVHVLNVGQADAIYIECPERTRHNMLIDSGDVIAMRYPGSPKLFQDQLSELLGRNKRIDVVVSTHPHSDHAGSLLWVLDNIKVKTFIDDGMEYESKTYTQLTERARQLAAQGKLRYLHATRLSNGSREPDFCPATNLDAILLRPKDFGTDKNPNNESVVIRLNYNQQRFLFTGDAEDEEEQQLLNDPATKALLPSTVLKAPHHGSNSSSSAEFLAAIQPTIIAVSAGEKDVGTNKGYKHPRAETIERFLQLTRKNGDLGLRAVDAYDTASQRWHEVQINAGLYVTSVDGSILLMSDGFRTWKDESTSAVKTTPERYVYSKNSRIYHFEECADAKRIRPENRVITSDPPEGMALHSGCPR